MARVLASCTVATYLSRGRHRARACVCDGWHEHMHEDRLHAGASSTCTPVYTVKQAHMCGDLFAHENSLKQNTHAHTRAHTHILTHSPVGLQPSPPTVQSAGQAAAGKARKASMPGQTARPTARQSSKPIARSPTTALRPLTPRSSLHTAHIRVKQRQRGRDRLNWVGA